MAIALRIPLLVVITKTDLSQEDVLERTTAQLKRILKSPGCNKVPILIEDKDDVSTAASNFPSGQYVLSHVIVNFAFRPVYDKSLIISIGELHAVDRASMK